VTLGPANFDATAQVKAANMFNADPEPGETYAIVPATVKYIGTESGNPNFSLQFQFVSAEGRAYTGGIVTMDGQLSNVGDLYTGSATVTGNVVMLVPDAGTDGGLWTISYLGNDPTFVAVQ
jgi:hypothetical protein